MASALSWQPQGVGGVRGGGGNRDHRQQVASEYSGLRRRRSASSWRRAALLSPVERALERRRRSLPVDIDSPFEANLSETSRRDAPETRHGEAALRNEKISSSAQIHTDQVEAATKLLFVHAPTTRRTLTRDEFGAGKRRQILVAGGSNAERTDQATGAKIIKSHQLLKDLVGQQRQQPALAMAASEQSFAPAQVAILAASGSEPLAAEPRTQAHGETRVSSSLVPRFEVLDFEVTNSTVTLTWNLSLVQVGHLESSGSSRLQKRDIEAVRVGPEEEGEAGESFANYENERLRRVFDLDRAANANQDDDEQLMSRRPPAPEKADSSDNLRTGRLMNPDDQNLARPFEGGALRPLPASSSNPTRRPPNRSRQPVASQGTTREKTSTTTTTTTTTSAAPLLETSVKGSRWALDVADVPTTRAAAVQLNKLASMTTSRPASLKNATSSTISTSRPTTRRQTTRQSKSAKLFLEPTSTAAAAAALTDPPSTTTTSSTTTTTTTTTTSTTTTSTTSTTAPPVSRTPSEVSISTVAPTGSILTGLENGDTSAELPVSSRELTATQTSTPTQTSASTPIDKLADKILANSDSILSAIGSARTSPKPTELPTTPTQSIITTPTPNVITVSKSQLITSAAMTTQPDESSSVPPVQVDTRTTRATQRPAAELPPPPQAPTAPLKSKWLVRLRRFGSNEIDVVKVVVSELEELMQLDRPLVRRISFKDLEPASGYELCVESASPNQLIGDKSNILNASHFLKCHDISDVELLNGANQTSSAAEPADDSASTRMEQSSLVGKEESASWTTPGDEIGAAPMRHNATQSASGMKSLCREFFTLNNLGQSIQQVAPPQSLSNSTNSTGDHFRRPKSLLDQQLASPTGGQLRSHMELLEIDLASRGQRLDPLRPNAGLFEVAATRSQSRQLSPVGDQFESTQPRASLYPAGRANVTSFVPESRFGPTSRPILQADHILPIVGCVFVVILLATLANMLLNLIQSERSGSKRRPRSSASGGGGGSSEQTYGSNSGSAEDILDRAQSPSGARFGRHLNFASRRHRRRRRRQLLSDVLSSKHQLVSSLPRPNSVDVNGRGHFHSSSSLYGGSFYSATGGAPSEHSLSSKSRMVVIGRNGEPFGSGLSNYFEVPPAGSHLSPGAHSASSRHSLLRSLTPTSSASRSARRNQPTATVARSMHLLTSAARFPLGPSFEGDAKHNADMVGLARRNYDNFINTIYNGDHLTSEVLANGQLHSGRQTAISKQRRQPTCSMHYGQSASGQLEGDLNSSTGSVSSDGNETNGLRQAQISQQQQQQQQQQRQKQRFRFDKVNPIYNMDNLQSELEVNDSHPAKQIDARRTKSLATFGTTWLKQTGGTNADSDQREPEECSICIVNTKKQQGPDGNLQEGAGTLSGNQSSSSLDKQQQRFQAQQQQLERVMSKSGSLVPQPFISVQDQVRGTDMEPDHQAHYELTMTNEPNAYQLDKCDETPNRFVFGESLSSTATNRPGESPRPSPPPQTSSPPRATKQAPEQTGDTELEPETPPVPPPPPPPLPLPTAAEDPDNRRQVATLGASAVPAAGSKSLDKSAFNQRRNELAAKLQLAGMATNKN